MKFLNRSRLLEKEKLEVVEVDLGNKEAVFVRQMTGRERERFETSIMKKVKDKKGIVTGMETVMEDFRAKFAVYTVCDNKGVLVFEPTDVGLLSTNMSAARLTMIADAAQKINKMSEEDKEDLLKNSEGGQAADSNSDSAEN